MIEIIETTCEELGLCCKSCGEGINLHRCEYCKKKFEELDKVYCKPDRLFDSQHWHKECYLKEMAERGK